MLVLSRKKNQTIVIDGQIEIEILKIKGNTVSLGINAPRNIKILRGEIEPFQIEVKETEDTADANGTEPSSAPADVDTMSAA